MATGTKHPVIVQGHPDPQHRHFCHALAEAYAPGREELVLEAAVNGQADALVTHNVRDFEPTARLFGLCVLLRRQVLKELER